MLGSPAAAALIDHVSIQLGGPRRVLALGDHEEATEISIHELEPCNLCTRSFRSGARACGGWDIPGT